MPAIVGHAKIRQLNGSIRWDVISSSYLIKIKVRVRVLNTLIETFIYSSCYSCLAVLQRFLKMQAREKVLPGQITSSQKET